MGQKLWLQFQMVSRDRQSSTAAFFNHHVNQCCVSFWPKYSVYFNSSEALIFPGKSRIVRPLFSKYFKSTTVFNVFLNWCFEKDWGNRQGLRKRGVACQVSCKVHWHKSRSCLLDYWATLVAGWCKLPKMMCCDNCMGNVGRITSYYPNKKCKYALSFGPV